MENHERVDQKRREVRQFLAEHQALLRRQGAVVESWRQHKGRRLGPYYRLTYREAGRQRSLYLGGDSQLAEEVREALVRLQAPLRQRRQLEQQKAALRRELARCRAAWNTELNKRGLELKGSEVRGWRNHR